jgi:hypothetical protein
MGSKHARFGLFAAAILLTKSYVALGGSTSEGDTQVKGSWKAVDIYMDDKIKMLKDEPCKMTVRVTYDKGSWMKMKDWSAQGPAGLCSEVLDSIDHFCRRDDKRAADARKKVHSVLCKHGPVAASLKGGALQVSVDGNSQPTDAVEAAIGL